MENTYFFKIMVHDKWQYYYMINSEPYIWDKTKRGVEFCGTVIDSNRLKTAVKLTLPEVLKELST